MLHILQRISMAPQSADWGPHIVLAFQWVSSLFVALWTARGLWRVAKASHRAATDQQRRRPQVG